MPCFHPLKAYTNSFRDGKRSIVFGLPRMNDLVIETLDLPCGKCYGCRLDYARKWTQRLMMESLYHEHKYFLTLTYDDEHVPLNQSEFSVRFPFTLRRKDQQDFLKRLREHCEPDKIRFFACGEYGSHTWRPHYHVIMFGSELPDLTFYKRNKLKNIYYNSDFIKKIWKNGDVIIGNVTEQSCGYVARYTLKKAGVSGDLSVFGLENEFVTMSRRPGLGFQYYIDHVDQFKKGVQIVLPTNDGVMRCKPSHYFMDKVRLENPELYEKFRHDNRLSGLKATQGKLCLSDYSVDELREIEEFDLMNRSSILSNRLF